MSQFAAFNSAAFATASGLALAPNAAIEVRRMSDGALASIFADEGGVTPLANPFNADAQGRFVFYAAGINHGYSVKATIGADVYTISNVPIGLAAQLDASGLGPSLMQAANAAAAVALVDAVLNAYGVIRNMSIVASVVSNALTVALKDRAGNDPSTSSPVSIPFRNATVATGDFSMLSVTAASSIVISSGSTLGIANATPFRLWLVGFNDGGTFRLGLVNCLSGTGIMPLRDDALASSTAEGGAGAADSAQVIYTGTAVSSKAMRVLGYLEWSSGLTTAGTWSAVPTKIQVFGPGIPLPGATVQTQGNEVTAVATGSTVLPHDDTVPQSTEGDQYMSQAITPASPANLLEIVADCAVCGTTTTSENVTMALFQDSTANALAAACQQTPSVAASQPVQIALRHKMRAGIASATTFKIRMGGTAGTLTFNGVAATRRYGGVASSRLDVREVMA